MKFNYYSEITYYKIKYKKHIKNNTNHYLPHEVTLPNVPGFLDRQYDHFRLDLIEILTYLNLNPHQVLYGQL